jgi:hypothetical protein
VQTANADARNPRVVLSWQDINISSLRHLILRRPGSTDDTLWLGRSRKKAEAATNDVHQPPSGHDELAEDLEGALGLVPEHTMTCVREPLKSDQVAGNRLGDLLHVFYRAHGVMLAR